MQFKRISPHYDNLKCFRYKRSSEQLSKYIIRMNSPTGIIKDRVLESTLRNQGYSFDDQTMARSRYEPSAMFEALRNYDEKQIFQPDRELLTQAYRRLLARFSDHFNTLEPASFEAVKWYTREEASAGAPYFVKKSEVPDGELQCFHDAFDEPCVAYYRTQSRLKKEGFSQSVRLVWGYPYKATLVEGRYARPLIDFFKAFKSDYALGYKKAGLGAELNRFSWCNFVGSFDWSKFDSSIPAELISMVFNLLKRFFVQTELDKAEWDSTVNYFINTPILMPNGKVYVGKNHGIPSGSYFTNIVGSLVNILLLEYLSLRHEFSIQHMLVHGDDSIIGVRNELPLVEMAESVANEFGMLLHPDKQRYTKKDHELEFLSHAWARGRPYRETIITAQQLVYAERGLSKSANMSEVRIQRLLGLYGDNHKAWPMIREVLKSRGLYRCEYFSTGWSVPKLLMFDPDFIPNGRFRVGMHTMV